MSARRTAAVASAALITALMAGAVPASAQQSSMSFFVTSAGVGNGANLGGLEGADKHCQTLAAAAGAGAKTWRAYLSTQGQGAVNAKDRIGKGPWVNAKGVTIAKDVAELHGANNLTKQTALSEKGDVINGRGDQPNRHDVLTGTQADGTAFPPDKDMTCKNWTSATDGTAMVGHSDRTGLDDSAPAKSWNASHPSRGPGGGCTRFASICASSSACRTSAPIRTPASVTSIASRPSTLLISTRCPGSASRMASTGTSDCPPASTLIPESSMSAVASVATASATVRGACHTKGAGFMS